ncbi:unnamed protein product [Dicrocoelium dendriticum]|nr:unnamed protein product [Dicrocoelium dendriticum]
MNTSSQSASIIQASVSGPSGSAEQLQQRTALTWILAFVELDRAHLLAFASSIIGAVLPCFSLSGTPETLRDRRTSLEIAVQINETLMGFVGSIQPSVDRKPFSALERKIFVTSPPENGDRKLEDRDSTCSLKPDHSTVRQSANAKSPTTVPHQPTISADAILEANFRLLDHHGLLTRLAAIRWLEILARVRPKEVLAHVIRRLPVMLNLLADPAADVVHSAIRLLGNLSIHSNIVALLDKPSLEALNIPADLFCILAAPSDSHTGISSFPLRSAGTDADEYATGTIVDDDSTKPDGCNLFGIRFMVDLVGFFDTNATLLSQRGDAIITDLCHVLGADIVYGAMSAIISHTIHLRSASVLVRALNRILLTQPALHEFRNQLRAINTKTGCHLLERLYRAWCHNPVALLSLFMLTEMYEQCSRLIKSFGEISMTVDTFVDMDQLVQLLESPIFATLRLHLLDKRYSAHLRETLYCLLMCLPQTDAFQTLWRRVQCIPPTANLSDWQVVSSRPQPDFALINSCIEFDALFDHFHALQQKYAKVRVGCLSSASRMNKDATSNAATVLLLDDALQTQNNAPVAGIRDFDSISTGLTADYFAQSLAKLGIHIPEQTLLHNTGAPSR